MSNPRWSMLDSLAAWHALDQGSRLRCAADLAETVGGEFVAEPELFGAHGLVAIRHPSTSTSFVAIPGGRFSMGLRADELDQLLAIAPEAVRPVVKTQGAWAQPVREVRVQPFLCARAPMLEGTQSARSAQFDKALRPDFSGSGGAVPCHLTGIEVDWVLKRRGWRLLTEGEWEYVAREGGTRSWVSEPLSSPESDQASGASDLAQNPVYQPSAHGNAFGVWGLLYGEWVSDGWHEGYAHAPFDARAWEPGAVPIVARAGAAVMWPWSDQLSWILCHAGFRHHARRPATVWGVRFAMDLPEPR